MLSAIKFENFKVLRKASLPLGRLTLIVGANGSGKSTALQALLAAAGRSQMNPLSLPTAGLAEGPVKVTVTLEWNGEHPGVRTEFAWNIDSQNVSGPIRSHTFEGRPVSPQGANQLNEELGRIRLYSLSANAIKQPAMLQPFIELAEDGRDLAGVLDQLRDREPERFAALNGEISRWLPEFDRILFATPSQGARAILLRTKVGKHKISASDLSQGTLLALAILTLAHLPDPPSIVCLEEIDRGIHPRLFKDIKEAVSRLTHPESFGESRSPVQVIATTHSPYMVDLFRDTPEEIVIAQKSGLEATFERLVDRANSQEIIQGATLGEVWFSGVLGGVPER